MSSKADTGRFPAAMDIPEQGWLSLNHLLPAIACVVSAIILVLFRYQGSTLNVLHEGSLTNLALIFYISAALLFGMYLMGREPLLRKMGMWAMGIAFTCNFAAWGVRWIEYVDHIKAQGDMINIWPTLPLAQKINHTFPLSNLYDITLGLTTWLGLVSVVVGTRKKYEFLGVVTTPVAALFLTLAIFLGNTITTLQPILRSYWRPIHVGVASLSYGVCAVTFAVGLLYLLKDNMKIERVALVISLFAIGVYLLIAGLFGNFSLISGSFGLNVLMGSSMGEGPVRFSAARGDFMTVEFPYIGRMIQLVVLLFLGSTALYLKDIFMGEDAKLRSIASKLFIVAVFVQALAVGMIFYQMKTTHDLSPYIPQSQLPKLALLIAGDQDDAEPSRAMPSVEQAREALSRMAPQMKVNFSSNPIVSASFFVIIAGGLFFGLFKLYGERIVKNMPPLEVLDDLNYKLVSICFPGFTLMLILGAVWANESWGTYWSWDPKETWGLITWVAYAGFLHTRFTHGWKGRRSAYFAIIGFLFMLFTYLGVSYLLPGLHSYA